MELTFELLREALSSGGDLAMILAAYGAWRIERRVTVLEAVVEKFVN